MAITLKKEVVIVTKSLFNRCMFFNEDSIYERRKTDMRRSAFPGQIQ